MDNGSMDHGSMDMGGMDMGGGSDAACRVSMLWNWNIHDACFLSEQWHIRNTGAFAGTVISVFLIVVFIECVRRFAREYDRSIVAEYQAKLAAVPVDAKLTGESNGSVRTMKPFRPTVKQQFIRSLFYFVQFSAAYIVMLLAMYFNGYIIFAIFLGGFAGFFVSSWDTCGAVEAEDQAAGNGCCC